MRRDLCAILRHAELRIRTQISRDLFGLHLIDVQRISLESRVCYFKFRLDLFPGETLLGNRRRDADKGTHQCRTTKRPQQ
jgi:hypothetical protein